MKKLAILFSSLIFFSSFFHKESFGVEILTEEKMDSVVAGNVSPRLTGKYEGLLLSDSVDPLSMLSGTVKFVVKRNGRINGSVRFSDGTKGKVVGSMGPDGTFGTALINTKKWGLGGLWGNVNENLSFGTGNWSRPNNFYGVFSIRKR